MTKQQQVYEALREEILDGVLTPGTRLVFADLATRFGVSPIPVREALRQLEREHLVEVHPHVKVLVKTMPLEEAVWASQLRCELEPLAAREAVPFVESSHLSLLDGELERMQAAASLDEFRGFLSGYRAFHDVLFSLTPNRRLVRTIEELRCTTRRYRSIYRDERQLQGAERELAGVLDALRARDAVETYQRLRAHRERLLTYLKHFGAAQAVLAGAAPATPPAAVRKRRTGSRQAVVGAKEGAGELP